MQLKHLQPSPQQPSSCSSLVSCSLLLQQLCFFSDDGALQICVGTSFGTNAISGAHTESDCPKIKKANIKAMYLIY